MCIKGLVSCVLMLANLVVTLTGAAIIIVGALIQWGGPKVYQYISPTLAAIATTSDVAGQSNFSASVSEVNSLMGQYVTFLGNAGIIIFGFGLIVTALGVVGCIGACCTLKILLLIYVICVGIIFLIFFILLIVVFSSRSSVEKWGSDSLMMALKENYVGLNSSNNTGPIDGFSRIFDVLQVQLNCCGISNYTDYQSAKKWNNKFYVNGKQINLTTPISCCKMKNYGINPIDPENCGVSPLNSSLNNFQQPCYPLLWKAVDKYSLFFGYALVGFTLVLFIVVILTICLIRMAAKDDFTCL